LSLKANIINWQYRKREKKISKIPAGIVVAVVAPTIFKKISFNKYNCIQSLIGYKDKLYS